MQVQVQDGITRMRVSRIRREEAELLRSLNFCRKSLLAQSPDMDGDMDPGMDQTAARETKFCWLMHHWNQYGRQ